MTSKQFQDLSHTIPHHPGIYKYFDAKSELLYVGKAKNLPVAESGNDYDF